MLTWSKLDLEFTWVTVFTKGKTTADIRILKTPTTRPIPVPAVF